MFVASVVITVLITRLIISPSNVSANYFFEKNQLFSEKLKTLTGPKFSATEKYKFVMGRRSLTNIHSHAEVVLSKKKTFFENSLWGRRRVTSIGGRVSLKVTGG